MFSRAVGQFRAACAAAGLLLAAFAFAAPGGEDEQSKRRLEVMWAAVSALEASSEELKPKALAAAEAPLLRYSDPTRGGVGVKEEVVSNVLLDAGVWRLGTEGRPTALVTTEIYQAPDGSRVMSIEFCSLTEKRFSLKHKKEDVRWDATASALTLKALPESPKPAGTSAGRLTQMRQLARRFAAKERFDKELIECRLIVQPIDRYHSEAQKIADGAIFAFANGTNPEIGVLLETDGKDWQYGVLRLTSAACTVTLDGKEVAAYEKFIYDRSDGAYNGMTHKIEKGK